MPSIHRIACAATSLKAAAAVIAFYPMIVLIEYYKLRKQASSDTAAAAIDWPQLDIIIHMMFSDIRAIVSFVAFWVVWFAILRQIGQRMLGSITASAINDITIAAQTQCLSYGMTLALTVLTIKNDPVSFSYSLFLFLFFGSLLLLQKMMNYKLQNERNLGLTLHKERLMFFIFCETLFLVYMTMKLFKILTTKLNGTFWVFAASECAKLISEVITNLFIAWNLYIQYSVPAWKCSVLFSASVTLVIRVLQLLVSIYLTLCLILRIERSAVIIGALNNEIVLQLYFSIVNLNSALLNRRDIISYLKVAKIEDIIATDTCIICSDILTIDSKMLPCSHIMHSECMQKWFAKRKSCPICRQEIELRLIKSDITGKQKKQQKCSEKVLEIIQFTYSNKSDTKKLDGNSQ